jgi:branched-chain amino acid aminotransferase
MSNFEYKKGVVFLRDNYIPFSEANVSIASSPVLYGLSVYTVFSVNYNEKSKKLYAFRLRDHFNRLIASSKIMDFNSFVDEWNYKKFEEKIFKLIEKNNIKEDVLVRVSVFVDEVVAGTKIHNLKNSLCAYIYPIGEILPLSGINVCVSSWTRNSDNSIPSRAKVNGGYANVSLMKNEAIMNGYDDAIALDSNGSVTEGTVANLFIIRNGNLITPTVNSDILEGITRDSIIRIARDMKLSVIERTVNRSELYISDEAFICGSSARITPILSIDKRVLGNGKIGSITSKLKDKYSDVQKGNIKDYADWRKDCTF